MNFQEPDDGFKPKYKPAPGMPAGMSPLPKDLPAELNKPDALPRGRGVRSRNPFPPKPIPGDFSGKVPRTMPNPTTAPRPVSSGPVINFPALARSIAWEILKPTPTADGTLPDFKLDFPDPEPEADSEDEIEICQIQCIPNALWYMPNNRGDGLVQLSVGWTTLDLSNSTYSDPGVSNSTKDLGWFKVLSSSVEPFDGNTIQRQFLKSWVNGQETELMDGELYVRYTYGFQYRGRLRITKKSWIGKIGLREGPWLRKATNAGPESLLNENLAGIYWTKRPTYYRELVWCRVPFCDDFDDSPPENDTDYDREDDGMACRWKSENDADVNRLEVAMYEYDKYTGCDIDGDNLPIARFQQEMIELPVGFADIFLAILRQNNQALGTRCTQFNPNYFYDLKPGLQNTVYAGFPQITGQEIELPEGCSEVGITFNASQAKSDTNLRDLKRISELATNENSFINVAQVWVIDDMGNAIANEQLWVPSTLIHIPLQYRQRICKLRLLTKSLAVEYTVFDSGARWQLRRGQIG